LFLLVFGFAKSQPKVIPVQPYNYFVADIYQNLYLINGSELSKYGADGQLKYRYSNHRLGAIESVDATNPLKILLFFRESNALIFLDHQLTEITGALDIYQTAGFEATHACSSSDGGFWLWHPVEQTVYHYNSQRVTDRQTQSLSDWLVDNSITAILESEQSLFVISEQKILVHDFFGTYLTTLALKTNKHLCVSGKNLIWFHENKLNTYQWESHQSNEIELHVSNNPKQVFVTGTKMILGFETHIEVHDLK